MPPASLLTPLSMLEVQLSSLLHGIFKCTTALTIHHHVPEITIFCIPESCHISYLRSRWDAVIPAGVCITYRTGNQDSAALSLPFLKVPFIKFEVEIHTIGSKVIWEVLMTANSTIVYVPFLYK